MAYCPINIGFIKYNTVWPVEAPADFSLGWDLKLMEFIFSRGLLHEVEQWNKQIQRKWVGKVDWIISLMELFWPVISMVA